MSSSELKRLMEDVRRDRHLVDELRALLSDPDAVLRWAVDKGYHLTREDVVELCDSDRELSDDDLEDAAGGDANWPPV